MKAGILTFACDNGKSGIGQYVIHLLRAFPRIAPEIEFELIGHADELEAFLPAEHPYHLIPIPGKRKGPIPNLLWQNTVLPRLCRARKLDVLFIPAANRRVPYYVPCPTVGTVHDFSSLHVQDKYDSLHVYYIKYVLPILVRRLTRIISASACTKRDIVEFAHCPPERIEVIPHGVDFETYYPRDKQAAQARVCAKYGIRPPYILYISRIEHPGKNHARLIQAFRLLKKTASLPHQLVFAGSDWSRAEEVHQEAHASGVGEAIRFTGFAAGEDLPDLYCGSDVFVFPSLYEGFGMPLLEAMACGVPMACSNISSLPEVAGDAAVLFDPYDTDGMANALGTLLQQPETQRLYIERGLARAQEFSWMLSANRTVREILSAANHGQE